MLKRLVLSSLMFFLPWSLTARNAQNDIQAESEHILSLQLDSGAVTMTPADGIRRIEPYFANLAMIGLLERADSNTFKAVEQWISWYAAHLNKPDRFGLSGTVYIYKADASGKESSLDDYDSSDSYGATFLTLAAHYYKAGGQAAFLQSLRSELETVAASVLATEGEDGLTRAKPDYPIAYLMDNCEVYEGLNDMAFLQQAVFVDERKSNEYKQKADRVRAGIASLWDEEAGAYKPYKGGTLNLDVFYPDAAAQLFPIAHGLIAPKSARAERLWAAFNQHQPGWSRLDKSDSFPWTFIGYVSVLMGDRGLSRSFYKNVKISYMPDHPWPWHSGESGFWMRMLKQMK